MVIVVIIIGLPILKAQNQHTCHSIHCFHDEGRYEKYISEITKIQESNKQNRSSDNLGEILIPVVVHVLYHEDVENISDQQIYSQIDVLNEAFSMENPSIQSTWPQTADVNIKFVLANVDPNGASTSGITRTYTDVSSFIINLNEDVDYPQNTYMKLPAQGGKEAWPKKDYLNIWVINMPDILKGFATFPNVVEDHLDGIVVQYQFFGNIGTANSFPAYSEGKSCVHEVGHWLNIMHPWGLGNNCPVNDAIADTPAQSVYHFSCANSVTECGNALMLENYMQYTNDACQSIFTEGQKAIMRNNFAVGGARENICDLNGYQEVTGGTISGKIWHDVNGNNTYTSNEQVEQGVEVRLFDCGGQFLSSATSNNNGDFEFTDLEPNNYYIRVTEADLPNDLGPHPFWLNSSNCFSITDNGVYVTDIPLLQLAHIESRVWEDMDGNGIFESGEPVMEGVLVSLRNGNGQVIEVVTTDAQGNYQIDRVYPDFYYLEFEVMNIYTSTIVYEGNNTMLDSDVDDYFGDNTTQMFELKPGEVRDDMSAGFYVMSQIGQFIWHDLNANGTRENTEPGLPNFEISLFKKNTNAWSVESTQYSDANGNFNFTAPPGEYYLQITDMPDNYVITNRNMGSNDTMDSDVDLQNMTTEDFSTSSGSMILDIGAGFYLGAGLGGIVWMDADLDGQIDNDEQGVSQVIVTAYNDQQDMVDQAITNSLGRYEFQGLTPDDYYLQLNLPNDTQLVPQPDESNYYNEVNGPGTTPYFSMRSDEFNMDINAGLESSPVAIFNINFNGERQEYGTLLQWDILSDGLIEEILIERKNSDSWDIIYTTGNEERHSFLDENEYSEASYYRLKITESTGKISYSNIIFIDNAADIQFNYSFINPFLDKLSVFVTNQKAQEVEIVLFNVLGNHASISYQTLLQKGDNTIEIDTEGLISGIYLIKLNIGNKTFVEKAFKS